MKKTGDTEMAVVRQKRFPSGNPDLGQGTAIPRCTDHDLTPERSRTRLFVNDEQTFCVPHPGNCVRKDGRA